MIEKKGDKINFLLEESTPAFANALRRIMMSEIPVLAIDVVEFEDNNSALFDEMLAHRLGMIPLKFDPKKFNFQKECKCGGKGCSSCTAFFALEKTGPSMILSSDLKSVTKSVKPTSPDFPVIGLLKNHHVKLEAKARLGTGREHAKFQAANVYYNCLPDIEVLKKTGPKKVADACPKGALAVKGGKLKLAKPYDCNECMVCEEVSDGGVKLRRDETAFVFNVETISGLDPKYIVEKAVDILESKAEEFGKKLKRV